MVDKVDINVNVSGNDQQYFDKLDKSVKKVKADVEKLTSKAADIKVAVNDSAFTRFVRSATDGIRSIANQMGTIRSSIDNTFTRTVKLRVDTSDIDAAAAKVKGIGSPSTGVRETVGGSGSGAATGAVGIVAAKSIFSSINKASAEAQLFRKSFVQALNDYYVGVKNISNFKIKSPFVASAGANAEQRAAAAKRRQDAGAEVVALDKINRALQYQIGLGKQVNLALGVGMAKLNEQMGMATAKADTFGSSLKRAGAEYARSFGSFLKGGILAGGAAAGAGAVSAVKTAGEFEALKLSLRTVLGSADEAAKAFDMVQKLATQLPMSLQEATQGFLTLQSRGITPTAERMIAFANIAGGMAQPVQRFIDAVADASTNEFERLKEFGIIAKQSASTVEFTFRGVSTSVGKNSKEIVDYLQKIGEVQFAGGAAAQMETLDGRLSNLGDALSILANKFATETGIYDWVKARITDMADLVTSWQDGFKNIQLGFIAFVDAVGQGWIVIKGTWKLALAVIVDSSTAAFTYIENKFNATLKRMASVANAASNLLPNGKDIIDESKIPGEKPLFGRTAAAMAGTKDEMAQHRKTIDLMVEDATTTKKAVDTSKSYNEELKKRANSESRVVPAQKQHTKAVKETLTVYQQIMKDLKEHRTAVAQAGIAQEQLSRDFEAGRISAQEYETALKKINDILREKTVYSDITQSITDHRKEVEQANVAQTQLTADMAAGTITAEEYAKAMERVNGILGKQKDTYTQMMDEIVKQRGVEFDAIEAEGKFQDALKQGKITAAEYEAAMKKLAEARGLEVSDKAKDDAEAMKEYYKNAAKSIQSTLADFLFNPFENGLNGMVKGVRDAITRMMAELLAAKAVKFLFGDFASTGEVGGAASSLMSLFSGAKGFASGGYYHAGVPRIVGERGPELDIPATSGFIVNNEALAAGGGAVNINIQALDGADVMRVLNKQRESITKMVSGTRTAYNHRSR